VPSRFTAPQSPPGNAQIANGKLIGMVGPGRSCIGRPSTAILSCRIALPAGVSSNGLSCASAPSANMAAANATMLNHLCVTIAFTPTLDLPLIG
jgi:hypothetical protein